MRLISNFTDYYEASGLAFGIDDKLVYVRKTEKVSPDILTANQIKVLTNYLKIAPQTKYSGHISVTRLNPTLIGFCGKLYTSWEYIVKSYSHLINDYTYRFTKYQQLINYLTENKLTTALTKFTTLPNNTNINRREQYGFGDSSWSVGYWVEHYSGKPIGNDIFYKLGTPVFSWNGMPSIIINPNLKELSFQHIVDPLTAFQEVSMYLGAINSQSENRNYSVGGDKIIAEQKGFDSKSFTQVAPTKKAKRKLNKQKKKQ